MSFASVGSGFSHLVLRLSSQPFRHGELMSVQLNKKSFSERFALCQFSLIARVVLSKGDQPWNNFDLNVKLAAIWNVQTSKLISIGKGFYHMLF